MLPSTEFYITIQRYMNNLSNLATSTGICPRTLSVPRCESRNLPGTDNVPKYRQLCFLSLKYFATHVKNIYEQLTELND